MDDTLDLEPLIHLESNFYASGFEGGHAHGALHGTFEGRALGKEKAFELWEEVGYYAGIAQFWLAVLGERESRCHTNLLQLLHLVSLFPLINPSSTPTPGPVATTEASSEVTAVAPAAPETDLAALLERIRARYKLTCSTLGVRPRMRVAAASVGDEAMEGGDSILNMGIDGGGGDSEKKTVVVNGVEVGSRDLAF